MTDSTRSTLARAVNAAITNATMQGDCTVQDVSSVLGSQMEILLMLLPIQHRAVLWGDICRLIKERVPMQELH